MEKILEETIQAATQEKEVLTRHIYKYCRKEDRIIMLPSSGEQEKNGLIYVCGTIRDIIKAAFYLRWKMILIWFVFRI